MGAKRGPSRARQALLAHRSDLLCLTALGALALAFLSPALKDGPGFGGFSDLNTTLTALAGGLHGIVHSETNGDAVSQMVSWNALDWRLIHSGHFPLWNDYSVLGMPQFLNFESSVLSLPDLISYAVPLRFAFLVVVFVKLLLAGSGTYFAARVLRARPLAALFGGASYMLAGAYVNWVTWPLSDVLAWSGFLLGFSLLAYRSPRWRYVAALAVAVAFSVFGGFPEANVMLALGFGALVLGALGTLLATRRRLSLSGGGRVLGGGVLGAALSSPLWWPGLQVISLSHRTHDAHYVGLPGKTFALLLTQGYYGLPTGPPLSTGFGLKYWNYYESVAYVGVVAVLLSLVAIALCWRRPVVVGLLLALVVSLAATYELREFHPLFSLFDHVSFLSPVRFERIRTLSAFFLALLGALGLEQLLERARPSVLARAYLGAALVLTGVTAYLAVDSLGSGYRDALEGQRDPTLRPQVVSTLVHQRLESLLWPAALCLLALVLATAVGRGPRRGRLERLAPGLLCLGEIGFLFFAGVGIPSYSHAVYPSTAATRELQAIVGSSLLGLDNGNTGPLPKVPGVRNFGGDGLPPPAGLYPNLNIGYSIRLFGVHDPLTPAAYYSSWPVAGAAPVNNGVGLFVPAITSATLARRYDIGYVLVASGLPAPSGMVYLTTLAAGSRYPERLYRVPGATRFSLLGAGRVSSVTDNGDGAFSMSTTSTAAATLVLRVTAVPGWHATLDGHPLAVRTFDGVMEAVTVPAGHHHLTLSYRPGRLVLGLLVALGALVVLVLGGLGNVLLRRRRSRLLGGLGLS